MVMVDEHAVHNAALAFLTTELAPIAVGDAQTPTNPGGFWLVLNQIPNGGDYRGDGFAGQPESITVVRFQVVAVGIQPEQVRWLASKAKRIMVGRDASNAYEFDPGVIAGHTVMDRRAAGQVPFDVLGDGAVNQGHLIDWEVHASAFVPIPT